MSEPMHSPLPWRTSHEVVSVGPTLGHATYVLDANGREVAATREYREETFERNGHRAFGTIFPTFKHGEPFPMGPNTALIVHRVNTYDDLLAALNECYTILLGGMQHDYDDMTDALGRARRAIAKAEGR